MVNGEPQSSIVEKPLHKIRKNPWILTTIFLVAVLFVALVLRPSTLSGKAVSEDVAAQNLLSFIKAQGSGEAELVSTVKNGSFYEITVNYQGDEFPVYVTMDGEYLVPSLIPLAASTDSGVSPSDEAAPADTPASSPAPANVVKSDKPKVEVFVMSHCPYGTQIEKGVIPVAELLGSKIDFSIKFVFYAMHGATEVNEQTTQYCIQKEQNTKFFSYLKCFLKEGKSDACLTEAKIDKTKLDSCIKAADKQFNITANLDDKSSWLNGNFPKFNIYLAENQKYGVQGSPALVINGAQVSSARDSASLLKAVCAAFNEAPEECGDTLSSASPSPGFGYGAAASGTAATCG